LDLHTIPEQPANQLSKLLPSEGKTFLLKFLGGRWPKGYNWIAALAGKGIQESPQKPIKIFGAVVGDKYRVKVFC
jgi:hypothetical protein